ncbi:MAG TPA: TMEM14 family protein, partial [Chthoniobacterales bacterium]
HRQPRTVIVNRGASPARGRAGANPRQKGQRGLPMQCMIGPAKIYFIIFGLLTIVGGVIGYVKAGSTISIIAGSISGIALIVAAFLLPGNVALGLALAGLISILLAGRFIPAFMKTGAVMPAGLMSILSVIGVIMAIVAWIKK